MTFWKRNTKPVVVETKIEQPVDMADALDQAKAKLLGLEDAWLRSRSLEFAQSLLTALGENPETLQNQLLIHQMAIENLRARRELVEAPRG
jgi:hypothetical protein